MKQYTIYCTEEQTKKALELGAPIENHNYTFGDNETCIYLGKDYTKQPALDWFAQQPTAEQMVGWFDEQHLQVTLYVNCYNIWCSYIYTTDGHLTITTNWFDTRKEATIAAIDAALEYLTNNKK